MNEKMYEHCAELCKSLKLPVLLRVSMELDEDPETDKLDKLEYLCVLLEKELEERLIKRTQRRIRMAQFPKIKTIDSFDFERCPHIPQTKIKKLLECEYIGLAEPIIFLGEPGTGKTHMATALGYAAAEMGFSVKFVSASKLANELIEAKDGFHLNQIIAKYRRVQLLILDELGYLPLRKTDAELIFQVLSDRHELFPVIITTNLPFSEWTSVFTDKRLCRALIDRITHRAHIIETGLDSVRLQETLSKKKRKKVAKDKQNA